MTKFEFLLSVPHTIEHKSWGFGEIEIVIDNHTQKGACYRHEDKTASYGNYGSNWKEVYEKMKKILIKEGHINLN